jgi:uncharacterized protein
MFNPHQKRLLALDGGGILGVMSLCFLKRIEDQLRPISGMGEDFRLCHFFDYIGGTSTGAIIAAGLAIGKSAGELIDFYRKSGAAMFQKASFGRRFLYHAFDADPLREMLRKEIGAESLLDMHKSGKLKTLLLIVTRNVTTDSPWPISTNPHAQFNDESLPDCNMRIPLWKLIRASTAAPTYFEPEHIEFVAGDPKCSFVFEDGGVTPYNNPALLLYRMATSPEYRVGWPAGEDRLMLVSVGTGSVYHPLPDVKLFGKSLLSNAMTIPGALMTSISVENDINCRTIGRCVYGDRLDTEIGSLIPVETPASPRQFLYARYNPDISQDGLAAAGLGDVKADRLRLDNVAAIPDLIRIGEKAADAVDLPAQFSSFMPTGTR